MKLCIDISARLDDAQSEILMMNEKLARNITMDQDLIKGLRTSLDLANMSYLSHWEFFAFLVNTKEIHEEKILGYYKDFFKGRVKLILDKYPQVRDNKERFNEIKKLLKEWDPKYYSDHFESNDIIT